MQDFGISNCKHCKSLAGWRVPRIKGTEQFRKWSTDAGSKRGFVGADNSLDSGFRVHDHEGSKVGELQLQ